MQSQSQIQSEKDIKLFPCDLIRISKKFSQELKCSQLLLCTKISHTLHFLDVNTHHNIHIQKDKYMKNSLEIIIYPLKKYGKQFEVISSTIRQGPSQHKQIWKMKLKIIEQQKQVQVESLFEQKIGRKVVGYNLKKQKQWQDINNLPELFIARKTKSEKDLASKVKKPKKKSSILNQAIQNQLKQIQKQKLIQKEMPTSQLKLQSKESYPSFQERRNSEDQDYDDQNYGQEYFENNDDDNERRQFQWYEYNSDHEEYDDN